AALNLVWQSFGWKDIKKGKLDHLYAINFGWPWISHLLFSFLPTVILTYFGATAVTAMRDALPMDGLAMKTLFTVGGMLPCVGIAILLRQIVNKNIDFVPFFVGFTLAASLKLNLVSITIIALLFAVIFYKIALIKNNTKLVDSTGSLTNDDEEEDI
ncbi:MAG TPA: PTS sorbose transporter subunit IIC, partial [Enterococcus faecalis]|nr:PTS sorbose transporter subunit IIC [Enterococcus faecalis]